MATNLKPGIRDLCSYFCISFQILFCALVLSSSFSSFSSLFWEYSEYHCSLKIISPKRLFSLFILQSFLFLERNYFHSLHPHNSTEQPTLPGRTFIENACALGTRDCKYIYSHSLPAATNVLHTQQSTKHMSVIGFMCWICWVLFHTG